MIAAAPATDAADLEALRRAFAAVVADSAFLRDAAKNRSAVSPTDGAKLTELVAQIVGRSSRVGELVRAMIECGKKVSDTGVAGCP